MKWILITMIEKYSINDLELILKCDLAGAHPIYLYWPKNKSTLLYSTSIMELLNDLRVIKPLKVSDTGISFLLQSGAIPPPQTIYQDIFIVSMGDKAKISTSQNKVSVEFCNAFPFMNTERLSSYEMKPNNDLILEMLFESIKKDIDTTKPAYMFHSAGKDSNMIALALAEGGWQDKVELVTHKSKGDSDESLISASIAKQLGFKHNTLYEIESIQNIHYSYIDDYFNKAPFPCVDNVTLAYPLYNYQAPYLKEANVIFGDGNDSYMSTPPSKLQNYMTSVSKITSKVPLMRSYLDSEIKLFPLIRTPSEWFGMSGFSLKDSQSIHINSTSVYKHWESESKKRNNWDLFDFKTDIYSTVIINEMMIRKLRNFTDVNNSNIVLPFTNGDITKYFATMPEEYLFDRKELQNKLILRNILKDKLNLDSDALGKKGWSYDSSSIVINNFDLIIKEIYDCVFWDNTGVRKVISRLKNRLYDKSWSAETSRRLIYRLYLLSSWLNKNEFIKNNPKISYEFS